MKKLILTSLCCCLVSLSAKAGLTNAVYWNFSASGVQPLSNSWAGLTVSGLSQGNNNGTTIILTPTSASSSYTTTAGFANSGSTNAGAAAFTGAINTSSSTYFQVSLDLDLSSPSLVITNFSFGSRSTSTGPQLLSLYSSSDGFVSDFNFVASVSAANNSSWAALDMGILSIDLVAGSTTYFRLYASAGTGSPMAGTANWRIDDLGIALTTAAVPEPSTIALRAVTATSGIVRRR